MVFEKFKIPGKFKSRAGINGRKFLPAKKFKRGPDWTLVSKKW